MPITSSAKKALRSSLTKRVFNERRSRAMRTAVKEVRKLAEAGKTDEARSQLSHAYKAIDKAMKRGVIKKNTAARQKSRLSGFLKRKAALVK